MIAKALSIIQSFQYYNYIFDAIVILFTVGYIIAGFKRGFARSLWVLFFDVITIVSILVIWKFVFPLFIGMIPVVGVGLFKKAALAFLYTAFYRFVIKFILSLIIFYILRCKIFRSVLNKMHEYYVEHTKKKRFVGRVFAAIFTGGIAFILSSGAISLTNEYTKGHVFKNYKEEVSETYVAKYSLKFFDRLVEKMVETNKATAATNNKKVEPVTFFTKNPIAFNASALTALSNAATEFVYMFNHEGHLYKVTIPAGAKINLDEEGGCAGPLYIGAKLGTSVLVK
jgi:hypothetical protein